MTTPIPLYALIPAIILAALLVACFAGGLVSMFENDDDGKD
jgi:hypothetical protein